ncbi:MAG: hypothetical protein HY904_24080 [Deltaproteobacteria bacterium]|nr:hypothetical protein [Deltaproteobacteria bacterium]
MKTHHNQYLLQKPESRRRLLLIATFGFVATAGAAASGAFPADDAGSVAADMRDAPRREEQARRIERTAHAVPAAPVAGLDEAPPLPSAEARRDALQRQLERRVARFVPRSDGDRHPKYGDSMGDEIAWFYDHPRTTHVVYGTVVGAEGVHLGGPHIYTRCTVRVMESFKGAAAPGDSVVVFTVGGAVAGVGELAVSHVRTCVLGTRGIFTVWGTSGAGIAVGSDDDHPTLVDRDGVEQADASIWLDFFRGLMIGRPE